MSDAKILPLLPVQDATGDVARRRPGRPRTIERKPSVDDLRYHAEIAKERVAFLDEDVLVKSVAEAKTEPETINQIRINLAREAADLEFQKLELGKRGRETGQVISRRADILLRLANLELEAIRAGSKVLDPRSEPMQKVFALWVEALQGVVRDVLKAEEADALFNLMLARLQDWETRVEEMLR
jgi:hypothetical protein